MFSGSADKLTHTGFAVVLFSGLAPSDCSSFADSSPPAPFLSVGYLAAGDFAPASLLIVANALTEPPLVLTGRCTSIPPPAFWSSARASLSTCG